MPKVTFRRDGEGTLKLYVAKKDLEANVRSLEHEGPAPWGGWVNLSDGSRFEIEVHDQMPDLPVTLRARRL